MKRISPNTVVIAIIIVFATLGAARVIRDLNTGNGLTVRFSAGFSHPVLLGGQQQTAFIKVDLTGFQIELETDRTPVNIAFVLDKSGSMSGQKMEQAIEATILAIDHLSQGDVVSVIVYDNEARVLMPATEAPMTSLSSQRPRYQAATIPSRMPSRLPITKPGRTSANETGRVLAMIRVTRSPEDSDRPRSRRASSPTYSA